MILTLNKTSMEIKRLLLFSIIILIFSIACFGQRNKKVLLPIVEAPTSAQKAIKSTAAYAEVLLRKTELEATLEDLSVAYTEDFPKVKETRFELDSVRKNLTKLLSLNESEAAKMTLALGKLLVRKAELETDLWSLKTKYGDEHPDVKRAKRRFSVFEKAVAEILP